MVGHRASRGLIVHELSICESIADIVLRKAADRRVETIHLRIGALRQVVPDTLAYCWQMLCADTELDGSALDIESVPAAIRCSRCGKVTVMDDLLLIMCEACDAVDVSVVSGEEFLITALDLVRA